MKDPKELLKIRDKIQNFSKYILEYGFNEEQDIFIVNEINKLNDILEDYQKDIENEEKLNK
jgi:ribosomal protein S15P/S13E